MKKEAYVVIILLLIFIITLLINMRITSRAISDLGDVKIEMVGTKGVQPQPKDSPYELVAYCEPDIGCKDVAFYYFPIEIKVNEKGELEGLTRPTDLSQFQLLCDNVTEFFVVKDIDDRRREQVNVHRFSCMWDFENKNYESDILTVIAMGKDKNGNTIISDSRGFIVGETRVTLEYAQKLEKYGTIAFILSSIILTILAFWFSIYIIRRLTSKKQK